MGLNAYQNQLDRIKGSSASYRVLMLLMEATDYRLATLARNAANCTLSVQQCEQLVTLMMDYADTAPLAKTHIVRINNLAFDYHVAIGLFYNG